MTTIKAECNTEDLAMLIDAARSGGSAILILPTEGGTRICLTAVQSPPNGKGRPRGPRTQTAGAAVE